MTIPQLQISNKGKNLSNGQLGYFVVNILQKAGVSQWVWGENDPKLPLLLLGGVNVDKQHGNCFKQGEKIISTIHHPTVIIQKPALQPLAIREVKNLLAASNNPSLLDLPVVVKHKLPEKLEGVFDLEWSFKDGKVGQITIIGFAESSTRAYSCFTLDTEIEQFRHAIKTGSVVAGHNIIDADFEVLGFTTDEVLGFINRDQVFDTLISAHINHPYWASDDSKKKKETPLGLYNLQSLRKFYGPCGNWKHLRMEDGDGGLVYNGYDNAHNHFIKEYEEQLLRANGMLHLLKKDQLLAAITVEMRQRGVKIDTAALEKYANEVELKKHEYVDRLIEEVPSQKSTKHKVPRPEKFNPKSHLQVKKWAKSLGIQLRNTEFETLKKHEGKNELFDLLIAFKEDTKDLCNWFPVEIIDGKVIITNEWMFPRFWVPGTKVGRLSSEKPNFQNITKEGVKVYGGGITKTKPNLRRFIIPREKGLALWAFDFKQVEDWTFGYCAKDEVLLNDLKTSDIHKITAAGYFSRTLGREVSVSEITKDQRNIGKATNHQAKYGILPETLSIYMFGDKKGEHVLMAEGLLDSYFGRYKRAKAYQLEVRDMAKRQALINPFGRRLKIYAGGATEDARDREFLKQGCHFMGCGTAADCFNQRLIDVRLELGLPPLLAVHDEGCYELGFDDERTARQIKEIFERPFSELGGLSLPVSVSRGLNYGSLQEIEI